jgi:exopolysaccharide production protein ExoZ
LSNNNSTQSNETLGLVLIRTGIQPVNSIANRVSKLEVIQICRGLAALVVVMHHITASANFYSGTNIFNGLFNVGWNGVDFFFVLSGFIITHAHYKDLGNKEKLGNYVIKRLTRIYPTYWCFLAMSAIFLIVSNSIGLMSVGYLLKCFFLIPQSVPTILGVSWSLCFEIIFYLIFAVYITSGIKGFIIGLAIHLLLILLFQYNPELFKSLPIFSTFANNFNLEFIIGCLTSIIFLKTKFESITRQKYYFLICGLLLFFFSWYLSITTEEFDKSSFNSRVFYGIASGLIILGAAFIPKVKRSFLSSYLLKVGDASYVLYLVHPLILALSFKSFIAIVGKMGISIDSYNVYAFCGIVLMACILFSLLFHSFVERPLIIKLNKILIKR